jgi:hypothetical protein
MRSFAVNIPFALTSIAGIASVYGIMAWDKRSSKRRDFLKLLAEHPAVPTETLMSLMDSKDPAALVRQMLQDKELPNEIGIALRRALTMLI